MRKYKSAENILIETTIKIVNDGDYNNITISELCNIAGVGRMSFYRNFNSLDDILRKYIKNITYEFINETKINYNNNLESYLLILLNHLYKYKDLSMNLYKINKISLIKDMFDEVFFNKYNNEYKGYYVSGSLYNIFYCWVKNNFLQTPNEIINLLKEF